MNLRIVEYELDYRHRVQVGVPSTSDEEAIAKAEAAFDDATLWDDTQDMPLLYDDYEEVDDSSPLCFKVVATVEAWPEPDHSVLKMHREAAAEKVCKLLMLAETLRKSGANAEYQRTLDQAYRMAAQVFGAAEVQGAPRPRVVVGVEGGLVQGASSDLPVDLVVVDYDVRNPDDGALAIPQSSGGESLASLAQHAVDLDPGFVEGVWRIT